MGDECNNEGCGFRRCIYDGTFASSLSIQIPDERIEIIGKLISPDGTVRKIAKIELLPGVKEVRYEAKVPLYDIEQVSVEPMPMDQPLGLTFLQEAFDDVDE